MKKLLLFCAMFTAAICMTGCKLASESGFVVYDYKIINMIESDIVVELGIENREAITIKPGDIRTISSDKYHYKGGRPESTMAPKILEFMEPEMKINGETMPELIWMIEYWKYDGSDVYDPSYFNSTYTLIVTDKLIETVKNQN